MNADSTDSIPQNPRPYRIINLNYVSLYIRDFQEAITFYSQVFGPPEDANESKTTYGWRRGATWLTVFRGTAGSKPNSNPRNAEFAIQVSEAAEVDALHQMLIKAGAREYMSPKDTAMYEPMRFSCVDDPLGVRIDIYCPLGSSSS